MVKSDRVSSRRKEGNYKTRANRKIKWELIRTSLRTAILSGKLKAGQHLRQQELAMHFRVSRMPIREALLSLHAEGLIEFYPHRGAVVTNLSAEEVRELLEARSVLEGMVAKYAIDNVTDADVDKLRELVKQMDSALDNPAEYFRFNVEFHNKIRKLARKKRLVEITENLRTSTEHYMRIVMAFSESRKKTHAGHYKILDALECRDKDKIERLARDHVLLAADVLAPYFEHLSFP